MQNLIFLKLDFDNNALYRLIHDARRKLKTYPEEQGLSTNYLMGVFKW